MIAHTDTGDNISLKEYKILRGLEGRGIIRAQWRKIVFAALGYCTFCGVLVGKIVVDFKTFLFQKLMNMKKVQIPN